MSRAPHRAEPLPAHRSRWQHALATVTAVMACVSLTLGFGGTAHSQRAYATPHGFSTVHTTPIALTEAADSAETSTGGDEDVAAVTAQLVLAPTSSALSPGDDTLELQALIRNPTTETLPAGSVTFFVTQHVTEGELDTELPILTRVRITTTSAAETQPDSDQLLTVSVPVDEFSLAQTEAEAGVYELWAEFQADSAGGPGDETDSGEDSAEDADEAHNAAATDARQVTNEDDISDETSVTTADLTAAAPLVWRSEDFASTVAVTIVVPLVLPAGVGAVPTPAELDAAAGPLLELLETAELSAATLAIDPRLFATIRAYGNRAPTSAQQLLERLEATFLPNFLLQFADADPAAQSALGFTELMQPSGLTHLTRLGTFDETTAPQSPEPTPAPEPTEPSTQTPLPESPDTPTPTEPPAPSAPEPAEPTEPNGAPSLSELLAWNHGYAGSWPAPGEVNQGTLNLLFANGTDSIVLDSSNATVVGGTRFALPGFVGFEAMVADTQLRNLSSRIIASAGPVDENLARAELAAQLALGAQAESSGSVLAFDRQAVSVAPDASELIEWIGALDWVSLVSEEQQAVGTGSLLAGDPSPDRIAQLRATIERSVTVLERAPLLTEPHLLDEYQQVRMLTLFATRHAHNPEEFYASLTDEIELDEQYLRGVEVVRTSNTQLVSTDTLLPVQLHNFLPFEASISLRATPLNASIAVPERLFEPVNIVAEGNATVLVPLHARVSSGTSAVLVQVADLSGNHIFFIDSLTLTLRTSLEAILLWALAGLAALLFAFGVWRSVQRRRRARNHTAVLEVAPTQEVSSQSS